MTAISVYSRLNEPLLCIKVILTVFVIYYFNVTVLSYLHKSELMYSKYAWDGYPVRKLLLCASAVVSLLHLSGKYVYQLLKH
jgi:hypothetical protein